MLKQTLVLSLFLFSAVAVESAYGAKRGDGQRNVSVGQARTLLQSMMKSDDESQALRALPIGKVADNAAVLFICPTAKNIFSGQEYAHAFAFAERFVLINLPKSRTRDAQTILIKVDLESRPERTLRFEGGGFQTYRPRALRVAEVMSQHFAKSISNRETNLVAQSDTLGADLTSSDPSKLDAIQEIRVVNTAYKAIFNCVRTTDINGGSSIESIL